MDPLNTSHVSLLWTHAILAIYFLLKAPKVVDVAGLLCPLFAFLRLMRGSFVDIIFSWCSGALHGAIPLVIHVGFPFSLCCLPTYLDCAVSELSPSASSSTLRLFLCVGAQSTFCDGSDVLCWKATAGIVVQCCLSHCPFLSPSLSLYIYIYIYRYSLFYLLSPLL